MRHMRALVIVAALVHLLCDLARAAEPPPPPPPPKHPEPKRDRDEQPRRPQTPKSPIADLGVSPMTRLTTACRFRIYSLERLLTRALFHR